MKKYWFKKNKGKGGSIPTTWQGAVQFVLVIGLITQAHNFVDGALQAGVVGAIIAGVGFWLMRLKTDPIEIYDRVKDKLSFKEIVFTIISIVVVFFGALGIGTLQINHQHSTIGYPVRIEGEPVWFKFNSIKDDFIIELPSYPNYTVQNTPIPNTDIVLTTSIYSSQRNEIGDFTITIAGLPEGGDYSDTEILFNNGINGIKNDLQTQSNEEPLLTIKPTETFIGYPSKSFLIEGRNQNFKMMGTLILAAKKLYILGYGSDKTSFSESNYTRFINSLKFEDVVKK